MKLVLFTLLDQTFAADVRQVKEVIRIGHVVPIPDCPDWVEGIIHLRGEVLPLISLSRKLHLPYKELGTHNRIIVSRRAQGNYGVVVDNVKGVLTVDSATVIAPDDIVSQAAAIAAVCRINGQLIPILDLDTVISHQESEALPQGQTAAHNAAGQTLSGDVHL